MARQTKAEIQAELDELLTTLKPRLEELVDIISTADRGPISSVGRFNDEAVTEVRRLVNDLTDLPAWEVLFPGDARVRGTSEVYRDLALEVAES
ncbi:hypothetical protein FDJ13_gp49 [Gordonia phage Gustav]|uniref:Uncharacterized protein n=1 Tax=Gordonia phage Gustav TaxID=2047872 RepID=A0A2H4PAK9_9CAUD|nr:hypothetical protein FDJ13_gp49 [Gordonia phage Gustav]ATW59109.1 hypothetical protein PHIRE_GUSTAV_49 [Gordonia phage Gustav]